MDRSRGGIAAIAEDLLRLLAAAMNAVRLYPLASPLRTEAIARFTADARTAATAAPMQLKVDRGRFIIGEMAVGEGLPQIAALSETLHALQVGQLIIAPGLTEDESSRFLDVLSSDAHAIRAGGGIRSALLAAGVANIAVIEVSLRASSEEGLLGLDLTTAPLEDIARELSGAVESWIAAPDAEGGDLVGEAIQRLEPAARDLAMRRCAEALMLLDEATRLRMLSSAMPSAVSPASMDGLLEVVAHMPPAALARLLRLTAESRNADAGAVIGAIEFPPELAAELARMLKPSPQTEAERGVPPEADVGGIAHEVAAADESDLAHITTLVKATTARTAAARGLITTVQMASDRPGDDTLRAVTEAVKPAVQQGALDELASAAALVQRLADDPALAASVQGARAALADPVLLETAARRLGDDPDSRAARSLLSAAGTPGAEALVSAYLDANELQRANLLPAATEMIESVAPIAGRVLRAGEASSASAMLRLLGSMHSRRLVPTIASGLEHLDVGVREAAIVALAGSPSPETTQVLSKALAHWDPETRRIAAREIGRSGNADAVPALLKVIAEVSMFERNYELKKEVLKSLEMLRSPQAIPALKRMAKRGFVIGKKNRELRYLAQRVLESLE